MRAKRGLIVMLPLVFAGLTMIGLLVGKTSEQNELSLYVELVSISLRDAISDKENDNDNDDNDNNDNDNDIDNDRSITTRYPNGTVFSPQDFANPTVIRTLVEQTGLNPQDLATNIDVQFGTPISNGVLAEYNAALGANSKVSAQDLSALNARYERKPEAAAKRGLKITVDYVGLGVTRDAGAQIAETRSALESGVHRTSVSTLPSKILGLLAGPKMCMTSPHLSITRGEHSD